MKTWSTITARVFKLTNISEKEGLVLRTLLNLNSEGVRKSLEGDVVYWCDDMEIDEAISIGKELCTKVMEMVDDNN